MKMLICVCVLLCSVSASAEPTPLKWPNHQQLARWMSDAGVTFNIGASVWTAARAENPKRALGCEALKLGFTIGLAETVKRVVNRQRPDGSDDMSFYSEHSAVVASMSGYRYEVGIPVAVMTGLLRGAANKHFATDIGVGLAAGFAASTICKGR